MMISGILLVMLWFVQGYPQFIVREGTEDYLKVEQTTGNVGIGLGTDSPQAKLDVAGSIRFRGLGTTITNPVITVDANGNLGVAQDQQGSGADGVVDGISISTGPSKTVTLSRSIGGDLTETFTDMVEDADADPNNERQRLQYNAGTGRLTIGNGGQSSGNYVTLTDNVEDHQDLDEVLSDGNNAQGREAVNFGRIGIGTATPGASLEVIGASTRTYPFSFPGGGNTANASIFAQDLSLAADDDVRLINMQSNVPFMNHDAGANAYRVGVAAHLVDGSDYVLASSMTIQDTYRNEAVSVSGKIFGPTTSLSNWGLVAGGLFETVAVENEPNIYALVADGDVEFRGQEAAVTFRNSDGYLSGATSFDGLIYFGDSGSFNIGKNTATSPDQLQIAAGGGNINLVASNILFNGGMLHSSDRRFKKNITPLDANAADLMQVQSVRFNWSDPEKSGQDQVGFIAQDIETVLPELVYTEPSTGYKYVNYTGMIPYLLKIVQEQQSRIEALEKERL